MPDIRTPCQKREDDVLHDLMFKRTAKDLCIMAKLKDDPTIDTWDYSLPQLWVDAQNAMPYPVDTRQYIWVYYKDGRQGPMHILEMYPRILDLAYGELLEMALKETA